MLMAVASAKLVLLSGKRLLTGSLSLHLQPAINALCLMDGDQHEKNDLVIHQLLNAGHQQCGSETVD